MNSTKSILIKYKLHWATKSECICS